MASGKRKPPPDDGLEVPGWMLTFSDCMTLLLTFFVLLLSFSSFDQSSLAQLTGSIAWRPTDEVNDNPLEQDATIAPQEKSIVDRTQEGAEVPQPDQFRITQNPRHLDPVQSDPYSRQKVFYIPARLLFVGEGLTLTQGGRRRLQKIGQFVEKVPCTVIVNESRPGRARAATGGRQYERACEIVQFFTASGLEADRFRVAATNSAPKRIDEDEPLIQITLYQKDPLN